MKLLISMIVVFASRLFAIEGAQIAVYTDGGVGTWEDGIVAFEHFLDWKGVTHERVLPSDVNSIELSDYYDAIYFPGGDADYYHAAISPMGIQHIQNLVSSGGGYIGICAGAEFACDKLVWDNWIIDYPLNFFRGRAIGPIDAIAVWPDYAMTPLSMNPANPINQFEPSSETLLYYGGCAMFPYAGMSFETVATFDASYDRNAIINFHHDEGRVLLIAPHPEIEEDSPRDGTNVAEELNDLGSDWPFLWSAVDWLLGEPISSAHIPSNVQVSVNALECTISWNPVDEANHYNVYACANPYTSSWTRLNLEAVVGTSFQTPVTSDHRFFRVTAIRN